MSPESPRKKIDNSKAREILAQPYTNADGKAPLWMHATVDCIEEDVLKGNGVALELLGLFSGSPADAPTIKDLIIAKIDALRLQQEFAEIRQSEETDDLENAPLRHSSQKISTRTAVLALKRLITAIEKDHAVDADDLSNLWKALEQVRDQEATKRMEASDRFERNKTEVLESEYVSGQENALLGAINRAITAGEPQENLDNLKPDWMQKSKFDRLTQTLYEHHSELRKELVDVEPDPDALNPLIKTHSEELKAVITDAFRDLPSPPAAAYARPFSDTFGGSEHAFAEMRLNDATQAQKAVEEIAAALGIEIQKSGPSGGGLPGGGGRGKR